MNSLKGKTVLVVDDEPDLRELMVTEFEMYEAKVFEATNGEEAFELLEAQVVDVIVSDILMPGGSGLELLEKLKIKDPNHPPVFFITGFSEVSPQVAIEKGAKNVFSKPFDWDDMIQEVAAAIN